MATGKFDNVVPIWDNNYTSSFVGYSNTSLDIPTSFTTTTAGTGTATIAGNYNTAVGHYYWPNNTTITTPNFTPNYDYGLLDGTTGVISSVEKFRCYPSSEGRLRPGRKELLFKLLQTTKLEYDALVKHLAIEEMLFNTVLIEYSLEFSLKRYMELMSFNSQFSKYDLFNWVIKTY
jgi:hypothetical protein